MTNFLLRLKPFHSLLLPLISGVMIGTSFPPFPSWAVTFCWLPLWFSLNEEKDLKKVFWKAWVTQFTLSLIGFHWIAHTAHVFGYLPWTLSVLALLLFCAFMHLHIPFSLLLAKWIDKKNNFATPIPLFFLLCALIQGLIERFWPMIFPWHLGYSVLYSHLEISQLAEFVGFQGLSSIFFLFNALFACGVWYLKSQKAKAWTLLATGVIIFFALNMTGALIRPPVTNPEKSITVLIVQANIGQFEKVAGDLGNQNLSTQDGQMQDAVLKQYIELTDEGLAAFPESQVIIWPETALPDYYDIEFLSKPRQLRLRQQVYLWKRALITGAYSRDIAQQKVYNGLFIFNDTGDLSAPAYRKSQLLVFGEYLPLGESFPFLFKLMPFVSSFGRGHGPEVKRFKVKDEVFRVAPQICYESLYDDFSRKAALNKPDFHVNLTNDSWFGTNFEPFQHGTMNWARAIETRRPLIRSTNTGQSSVILHDGSVILKSPLEQEWYGAVKIPLVDTDSTFFMKRGYLDWVLYLVVLLILVWILKTRQNRN